MATKTIDLEQEARRIREKQIKELDSAMDEMVEKFLQKHGDFENVPRRKREAYEKLEEEKTDLKAQADAMEEAVEEWGDGTFVISTLTLGQVAKVQDRVSEASFEFDAEQGEITGGVPREGLGMVEAIREAITHSPEGSPMTTDPETGEEVPYVDEYHHQVGMFLFEKINEFNTIGEGDMGNTSLRERMNKSKD